MPTESEIRSITLSYNYGIHVLSVKVPDLKILLGNIAQNSFHLNHTLLNCHTLAFENEKKHMFSVNLLEIILVFDIILKTQIIILI